MSDTKVYEPQVRTLLGIAAHFCTVVVLTPATPNPVHLLVRGVRAKRLPPRRGYKTGFRARNGHLLSELNLRCRLTMSFLARVESGHLQAADVRKVQRLRGGLVFKAHRPLQNAGASAHDEFRPAEDSFAPAGDIPLAHRTLLYLLISPGTKFKKNPTLNLRTRLRPRSGRQSGSLNESKVANAVLNLRTTTP